MAGQKSRKTKMRPDVSTWEDTVTCQDAGAMLAGMPDGAAEMILTDLPYGVINRPSAGIRKFDKAFADETEQMDLPKAVAEMIRVCRGSIYIFCSTEQVSELRSLLVEHGLTTRLGIWEKTNPSPVNCQHLWMSSVETCVFGRKRGAVFNEHYKSSVWRFPVGSSKLHPTQKSQKLFEYLIETSSNLGDLIVDPFAGSGTTALAAAAKGRKFSVGDLSSDCSRLIASRLDGNKIPYRVI